MGCIWSTPALLAVLATVGTGCPGPGSDSGEECSVAMDCGPTGDAACVGGDCLVFDEISGYGGAVVDLSFGRDMYSSAKSGYLRFFLRETAAGRILSCSDYLAGGHDPQAGELNLLQANPKYLVFHWDSGGTFFPNNLVQFIRPATGVLAVAEGYQLLDGEGDLTAIGCRDGIEIVKDQNADVVIPLNVPDWR